MLVINDHMVNNSLTTRDILKYCRIGEIDKVWDEYPIRHLMTRCFKLPFTESEEFFKNLDFESSLKFYDYTNQDIYGLLLFSNKKMKNSIPNIKMANPIIANIFNGLDEKEGSAFILDKRLQGIGLDKLMLKRAIEQIKNSKTPPDVIWLGVNRELKSHNYWKRLGFIEFYSDPFVKFYFNLLDN